ncbi:MAG TPA: lysozyme inhibitor LprI family protein [Bryobacteraceae bacterium]|nr:lysozyme inhibitor LprI family protein [Bryobacteraceae bacterium]
MLRFCCLILLLAVGLRTDVARGQTPPAANRSEACQDASTTAAMRSCENTRYEAADRRLNEVYSRLMGSLGKSRQEKLQAAQRAWLQFRDANAAFLSSSAEGGTLEPLIRITALADITEARITELMKVEVR